MKLVFQELRSQDSCILTPCEADFDPRMRRESDFDAESNVIVSIINDSVVLRKESNHDICNFDHGNCEALVLLTHLVSLMFTYIAGQCKFWALR